MSLPFSLSLSLSPSLSLSLSLSPSPPKSPVTKMHALLPLHLADQMRQYFTQMRQEIGQRIVERVFGPDDKPSKVDYAKALPGVILK